MHLGQKYLVDCNLESVNYVNLPTKEHGEIQQVLAKNVDTGEIGLFPTELLEIEEGIEHVNF